MEHTSPNLKELIEQWIKDDPQLHHFHLKRLSWTWLICDCIDHAWNEHPGFRVTRWGIEIFKPWCSEKLSAADPKFFERLKSELIQNCLEAQSYGTL